MLDSLESRTEPLAPISVFLRRFLKFVAVAGAVVAVALGVGILGYHYIAKFSWIDSLLNASMILGGMGPLGDLPNDAAKLFASAYALFSGLMFISITGILLTPFAHRTLHVFHLDEEDLDKK